MARKGGLSTTHTAQHRAHTPQEVREARPQAKAQQDVCGLNAAKHPHTLVRKEVLVQPCIRIRTHPRLPTQWNPSDDNTVALRHASTPARRIRRLRARLRSFGGGAGSIDMN